MVLETHEKVHPTETRIILNLQRFGAKDENGHRPQALQMKCHSHFFSASLPQQLQIRKQTSETEDMKFRNTHTSTCNMRKGATKFTAVSQNEKEFTSENVFLNSLSSQGSRMDGYLIKVV